MKPPMRHSMFQNVNESFIKKKLHGSKAAFNIMPSPAENATPRKTLKRLMARTSSQDEAAITSVGIPCSTPKPFCCRTSSWGTTTAGDTAARTKLTSNSNEFTAAAEARRQLVIQRLGQNWQATAMSSSSAAEARRQLVIQRLGQNWQATAMSSPQQRRHDDSWWYSG